MVHLQHVQALSAQTVCEAAYGDLVCSPTSSLLGHCLSGQGYKRWTLLPGTHQDKSGSHCKSDKSRLTVRYSQKGSSSLGPVGKCAKLEPMEAMNWPKKELPFRMGTPMVVGTVHLCATISKASGMVCEAHITLLHCMAADCRAASNSPGCNVQAVDSPHESQNKHQRVCPQPVLGVLLALIDTNLPATVKSAVRTAFYEQGNCTYEQGNCTACSRARSDLPTAARSPPHDCGPAALAASERWGGHHCLASQSCM